VRRCLCTVGAQELSVPGKIIRPMTACAPLSFRAKRLAQTGEKARVICGF
jgi:hypothetical protein